MPETCPHCKHVHPNVAVQMDGLRVFLPGQHMEICASTAVGFATHVGFLMQQFWCAHRELKELRAARVHDRPRIVCLCGSTRFMEAFFAAGWELTLLGQIVLSVGVCKHSPDHGAEALGGDVAHRLDELHLRKIDVADWVLVLDLCGYVGRSTTCEMNYAEGVGKPVIMLFGDDALPRRTTPPAPDEYQSWDSVAAAARDAAQAAEEIG